MSLSQKIAAALESSAGPGTVSAQDGPHRLELRVEEGGPVGVAFSALEFATGDHAEWSAEALRAWGDRLSGRVTYLMEPLVVLEVDPVLGEAELRSEAPTARHGRRSYYEVRLNRAGRLRLGRVVYDDQTRRRRPAPCQVTREMIERLADDLVASAG